MSVADSGPLSLKYLQHLRVNSVFTSQWDFQHSSAQTALKTNIILTGAIDAIFGLLEQLM